MGQSVLPEKDSSQPEDTADGESASQSSIWTTKWSYNEEFRPKWVWDEWRGCWAKLHPCRCLRGPRICLGYAVKYDLFLCKNCHARTAQGEVHDRCTCTCDGCSGPPAGNPEQAPAGGPAHDDHVRPAAGERADSPRPDAGAPAPQAGREREAEDHVPAPPPPHAVQRRAKRGSSRAGDIERPRTAPEDQARLGAPEPGRRRRSSRARMRGTPWHEVGIARAEEDPGTLWTRTRSETRQHGQRLCEQRRQAREDTPRPAPHPAWTEAVRASGGPPPRSPAQEDARLGEPPPPPPEGAASRWKRRWSEAAAPCGTGVTEHRRREAPGAATPRGVRAPTPTHAGHHDAERRPAGQGPTYTEPTRGGGAGAPTEEDITQATLLAANHRAAGALLRADP